MKGKATHCETIGRKASKEYAAWRSMIDRCYNTSSKDFKNYGGRGIIVCDRWRKDFVNFLNDMKRAPSSKHSLGRINNNGNYESENCEWQTSGQQNQNQTTTKLTMAAVREIRMLYSRGYTQSELATEFGVDQSNISYIVNNKTWREN